MLKYEQMLHLDEHYKKMQECAWQKTILMVLGYLIGYTFLFYFLRCAAIYIPDSFAWSQSKGIIIIGKIQFLWIDFFYFIGGLITICYGAIRLDRITKLNHSVRKEETPRQLLTYGYYEKLRHPMYGDFILMYAGVLLSMRSRNGLILMAIFVIGQYLNGILEEKQLRVLFQKEYMVYCNKTKGRLLTKVQIILLLISVMVTLIGFMVPFR